MPPAIHQKITYSKFSFENDLELQVQFNKPHCDTRGFSSSYLSTSLKVVSTQNFFFQGNHFLQGIVKRNLLGYSLWTQYPYPSSHSDASRAS